MDFEWDPAKNEANLKKHGIGFDEAQAMFEGPILSRADKRRDYGEDRHISLGAIAPAVVFVVVHTERGGNTRLIFARKANERERKIYYDHFG